MLVLQATDVRKALPMDETIAAMKRAFATLFVGDAEDEEALAVKIVSVFPRNTQRGLPIIHAAVLVLDADVAVYLSDDDIARILGGLE